MIIPDFKNFTKKQKCLFGVMLGDALGVPFEFHSKHQIKPQYIKNPNIIPDQYRSYSDLAPLGVYSDDFSQTLCVEEFLNDESLAFDNEMLQWLKGKYWVNNELFDVGNQTFKALKHYSSTGNYLIMPDGSGNGGIMRLAPVAFSDHHHAQASHLSAITHNSKDCFQAAEFYVMLLWMLANNTSGTFDDIWQECKFLFYYTNTSNKLGSGYVLDTLDSIYHCITTSNSFVEAITAAIMLGDDTDTTASVVGAVAALYFDYENIPDEWLQFIQPSLQNPYVKKLFETNLGNCKTCSSELSMTPWGPDCRFCEEPNDPTYGF